MGLIDSQAITHHWPSQRAFVMGKEIRLHMQPGLLYVAGFNRFPRDLQR